MSSIQAPLVTASATVLAPMKGLIILNIFGAISSTDFPFNHLSVQKKRGYPC
jgi:hypothetical protein